MRGCLGIVGGFVLMALASQVKVPLPGTVVPGTLQLLAVLLVGFLLRPWQAASTMLLYLVVGSCGVGVFSLGSAGLAGATCGFLVGFLVTASLVSLLTGQRRTSVIRLYVVGALGTVCLFSMGVAGMMMALKIDAVTAIRMAVAPFALKAVVELVLAVTMVRSLPSVRRMIRGDDGGNALG